mmetsp:Transcript_33545/g.34850  ORF Transcript_33545/g.34850 Transcript_33545/m.34850 type:complete len:155 (+) Transcript_33545:31-495(+)
MSYSYYNYLKKYSPRFILKYESGVHSFWGRRSVFSQLVFTKAFLTLTPRVFIFPTFRASSLFFYLAALYSAILMWGIWYFQDIHHKYTHHKWVHYQPWMYNEIVSKEQRELGIEPLEEKKPLTRLNYEDSIKIIYNGEDMPTHLWNTSKRFRYR